MRYKTLKPSQKKIMLKKTVFQLKKKLPRNESRVIQDNKIKE